MFQSALRKPFLSKYPLFLTTPTFGATAAIETGGGDNTR